MIRTISTLSSIVVVLFHAVPVVTQSNNSTDEGNFPESIIADDATATNLSSVVEDLSISNSSSDTLMGNDTMSNNSSSTIALDTPMPELVYAHSTDLNSSDTGKKVIKILTTVNYSGFLAMGPTITETISTALDRLKAMPNFLSDYEIVIELIDDGCDDATAVNELVARLRNNDEDEGRFPITILTDCIMRAQLVTSLLLKPANFIGLAIYPLSLTPVFEHSKYPNYFWLSESGDAGDRGNALFLTQMGWRRIAILSEVYDFWNEMDRYALAVLEDTGIKVLYLAKVDFQNYNNDGIADAFEELRSRDPRVIFVAAGSTTHAACWCHRTGMYGPNYVILMAQWLGFTEDSPIPEVMPWCTREMLLDVLKSVIYAGDATLTDIDGPETHDSTGFSMNQLATDVASVIPDADKLGYWGYWIPYWWDRTLALGLILNNTETLLKQRNQTLSDWTTNSENFQQHGQNIVEIMTEAVMETNFAGFKGEYQFNSSTKMSSGGIPVLFQQVVVQNGTSHLVPIAYYMSTRKEPLILLRENMVWQTADKQPPKDALIIMTMNKPILEKAVNISLKVMSLLGIVMLVALVVTLQLMHCRDKLEGLQLDLPDVSVLCGDGLILISGFVMPIEYIENITFACSAVAMTVSCGYSLVISGMMAKLNQAFDFGSYSYHPHSRVISVRHLKWQKTLASAMKFISIFWFLSQGALTGTLLAIATSLTVENNLPMIFVNNDNVLAYRPIRQECNLQDVLFGNSASTAVSAVTFCLQGAMIIRSIYLALMVQLLAKKHHLPEELRRYAICTYCLLLLIMAGAFISVLDFSNTQHVMTTLLFVATCFVFNNIALLGLPKVYSKIRLSDTFSRASVFPMSPRPMQLKESLRASTPYR